LILACAIAGVIFGATIVFSIADHLPDVRPDASKYEEYVEQGHFASSPDNGRATLDDRVQRRIHR
jgi:hypothetical protein